MEGAGFQTSLAQSSVTPFASIYTRAVWLEVNGYEGPLLPSPAYWSK